MGMALILFPEQKQDQTRCAAGLEKDQSMFQLRENLFYYFVTPFGDLLLLDQYFVFDSLIVTQ